MTVSVQISHLFTNSIPTESTMSYMCAAAAAQNIDDDDDDDDDIANSKGNDTKATLLKTPPHLSNSKFQRLDYDDDEPNNNSQFENQLNTSNK